MKFFALDVETSNPEHARFSTMLRFSKSWGMLAPLTTSCRNQNKNTLKNLFLALGLFATTVLIAQDSVYCDINIAPFNHLDYTFADIFYVDREGNVDQRCKRRQLLPGGSLSGTKGPALNVGSLVIVDMYNRHNEYTHSYSAYIVNDDSGNVSVRVVEDSPKISLVVGNQKSYIDFLLEAY